MSFRAQGTERAAAQRWQKLSVVGLFLFGTVVSLVPITRAAPTAVFDGATPLVWSQRLAGSEIERRGDSLIWSEHGSARWDYAASFFHLSLLKLSDATNDPRFRAYAEKAMSSFIASDGTIRTYKAADNSLDNIAPGRPLLSLYKKTHEERYLRAMNQLLAQLAQQPRTQEGGFWHKQRYPNQMWLDGVYMAEPFRAHFAKTLNHPELFPDIAEQFSIADRHTYDVKTGLYYHGWDESKTQSWANPQTGTSSQFWGRAVGWYAMALVDTLDVLPADRPDSASLRAILNRAVDGIVRHQDPDTGVWFQVLDQPARMGNYREATASAMFVYALSKAVNRGWIDREKYLPIIAKAYAGLLHEFVKPDAKGGWELTQCCSVAGLGFGREGTFDYYIHEPMVANDLKGIAPFILAGIEVQKLLGPTTPAASSLSTSVAEEKSPEWRALPAILARIHAPIFPSREFVITAFGAKPDGTPSTQAIAQAVSACAAAGGGRVRVPAGTFATGPIHLLSHVELHLDEGAILQFSTNPSDYLPGVLTRSEGIECWNYSPFIYALDQTDIAITGTGMLDGGASDQNWWSWTKRGNGKEREDSKRLVEMGAKGIPILDRRFGEGHFLRPVFFQPYRCQNILIEGVHIRNSPMWEINPVLCRNVTVRGVDIFSHGPNNDGCDPECSEDVLIEECTFDTGDDCIAIKSGRNEDGRRIGVASSNIVIRDCTMKDGHGGVVIGSEVSGGCHDIFVQDCKMDSPHLERALRLKSNAERGGVIENIFMRRVDVGRVAEAILTVDFLYEEGAKGAHPPTARNIRLENVISRSSPRVLYIAGFPGATIDEILFKDCAFSGVELADLVEDATRISFNHVTIEPAKKSASLSRR